MKIGFAELADSICEKFNFKFAKSAIIFENERLKIEYAESASSFFEDCKLNGSSANSQINF